MEPGSQELFVKNYNHGLLASFVGEGRFVPNKVSVNFSGNLKHFLSALSAVYLLLAQADACKFRMTNLPS